MTTKDRIHLSAMRALNALDRNDIAEVKSYLWEIRKLTELKPRLTRPPEDLRPPRFGEF